MNVARFNFSHGDYEEHKGRFNALRALSKELDLPVAAMLDTKGPEIRLGTFKNGVEKLVTGQKFTLTSRSVEGTNEICSVTYKELPNDVKPGGRIMLDDGLIELRIDEVGDTDIVCTVCNDGIIKTKKGVTVLELTQTNLGTLGVQHTGNGQVQLLGQCAYLVIAALVLLVVAMRKVETRDVHAVLHQLAQNARLIGGRTHSTDDLGFTHKAYPPFYISTYSYTLANLSGIILQVRRGRQEENGFRLKKTAQKLFPCSPLIFTQFQLVQCKFCHSPGTARLTGHWRSSVPGGSDLQAWIACLLFAVFTV